MRALLALTMVLSTGCMSYLQSGITPRPSPRADAGHIALGGAAQVILGSLVAVGSYYLYQSADPTPPMKDEITGQHAGVAGVLLGTGLVISGIADGTIALYQLLLGEYLYPSPKKTDPGTISGAGQPSSTVRVSPPLPPNF